MWRQEGKNLISEKGCGEEKLFFFTSERKQKKSSSFSSSPLYLNHKIETWFFFAAFFSLSNHFSLSHFEFCPVFLCIIYRNEFWINGLRQHDVKEKFLSVISHTKLWLNDGKRFQIMQNKFLFLFWFARHTLFSCKCNFFLILSQVLFPVIFSECHSCNFDKLIWKFLPVCFCWAANMKNKSYDIVNKSMSRSERES